MITMFILLFLLCIIFSILVGFAFKGEEIKTTSLIAAMCFVVCLSVTIHMAGHKEGQIDAYYNKFYWRLRLNSDGTKEWNCYYKPVTRDKVDEAPVMKSTTQPDDR